jgi:hypothetical protein
MGKAIICDLQKSKSFGRLSLKAKALWPMLLISCDDQGRGEASPDVVKWYVCPNVPEIAQADIPDLMIEMEAQGMIHLYEDEEGEPIFQVINWWEYQSLQWAQPSKIPAPDGWTDRVRYNVRDGDYIKENWAHPGGFATVEVENPPEKPGGNPGGNPPTDPAGPTREGEEKKKRREEKIREQTKDAASAPSSPPPSAPDPQEMTVDGIKRLDLDEKGWENLLTRERQGKNRVTAVRYIKKMIRGQPPPSVQVYRSKVHLFPESCLWPRIDEAVGQKREDLAFWGKVIEGWVMMGWKKTNLSGMLDFFERREIPGQGNGNGKGDNTVAEKWEEIDQWAET